MEEATEWRAIRPWRPTLTLTVREITSVSVTFILSSLFTGSDSSHPEPSLASLGLSSADDDEDSSIDANQIVSDVLAKGLSVKVNGIPWQRVLMKVDEESDEAVIILFGLMPGRQYDVELGILPGERSLRGQITTDVETLTSVSSADASQEEPLAISPSPHSNGASPQISASSSLESEGSASRTNGHSAHTPLTLEDRRLQLTHMLNVLNAEHSSLTTSLKTARRESQKADAALRSEIDTLKRASDRHAAGEHRARQKVLALQEAAKQTHAAAGELEGLIKDIESALPALEERKVRVEKEWGAAKSEAERVRVRREEAETREKTRIEGFQVELAGLGNRLERLNAKQERLEGEGGLVAELEEKLRRLEEERQMLENGPYGYEGEIGAEAVRDTGPEEIPLDLENRAHIQDYSLRYPQLPSSNPHPRKRHSHPHYTGQHQHTASVPPKPIGPIQRPPHTSCLSLPGQLSAAPGVIHLPAHSHSQSHSHAQKLSAARLASHSPGSGSGSGSGSSSASSTTSAANPLAGGTPPHVLASSSSLSSRAPPFEPAGLSTRLAAVGAKSDLNPGSSPFSPRLPFAHTVASQTAGTGAGSNPGKGMPTPPP